MTIRQQLVFLTGHRVADNATAQEVGSLSKIGAAIAFASFLAALQFGIAGWFLAMDLNIALQILMAITFAVIGAGIVLVLDRNFIYLADTRYETDKKLTYVYLGIRIFLITVIGSLSSQFTMPLFLKSELAIHAQDMKNGRYSDAKQRYQEKHELTDKTNQVASLEQRETRLKKEISALTPELVRQRNQVNQCFSEYTRKTRTTFAPDLDEAEILNLYAKDKRECERLDGAYRSAYKGYVSPRETELSQMGVAITSAQSDVEVAKKEIASDLTKSSQIDEAYINVASADVLSSLVTHSPGVFFKYALITLLQLCLELMPILLKLQAGQSGLGHRMAIFAYENKTKTLAQMNQSASKRMDSDAELELAQHEKSLIRKEQYSVEQAFDSKISYQKVAQDLEKEKLRSELEEIKRKNSAYGRMQQQFSDGFNQASHQFINRVVMPVTTMAHKPFGATVFRTSEGSVNPVSTVSTVSTASNVAANASASPTSNTTEQAASSSKSINFGYGFDMGAKAAS
jgi:hypothetical protein